MLDGFADSFFLPSLITRAPSPQPGRNAYYGGSIRAVDIDSDGRLELAAGAWNEDVDAGFNGYGACRIVSLPSLTEAAKIVNPRLPERNDYFGYSIGWGDADNDGLPEMAVGIPGAAAGSASLAGHVLIFSDETFGKYYGLRHTTPNAADLFGSSCIIADLLAEDGEEILIGAPFRDGGEADTGEVVLFGASPVSPYPEKMTFTPQFPFAYGRFGSSLAAGDFDGDGSLDIAIGAEGAGDGGEVYIYYGPSFTRTARIVPYDVSTNLYFGRSMAAGDINGDGVDDLAVGRPGADLESSEGAVDLILGPDFSTRQRVNSPSDSVLGFGNAVELADLDGDGKVDLAVGAIMTPSPYDPNVTGAGEIILFTTSLQLAGVPPLPGDVDGDEDRDYMDLFNFADQWQTRTAARGGGENADQNRDGLVDADDAAAVAVSGRASAADLNGDGRLSLHDLMLFGSSWQREAGLLPGCDFDRDGFVDDADLRLYIREARRQAKHQ